MTARQWHACLVDVFHPYLDLWLARNPTGPPERLHRGVALAFDPLAGTLLALDPGDRTDPPLIYELTPTGQGVRTFSVPCPEAVPRSLAVDPRDGTPVVGYEARRLAWVSRSGDLLASRDLRATGLGAPGPLTFHPSGEWLAVLDPAERRLARLTREGRLVSSLPVRTGETVLSGLALTPDGVHLLVASHPSLPGSTGQIAELTLGGEVRRVMNTAPLGFCPLDLTVGPGERLFVLSRPYVLPQTPGDHSHVFVIDPHGDRRGPAPNPAVVRRFLRANNLLAPPFRDRAPGQSTRWPDATIEVGVTPGLDRDIVDGALEGWSAATGGSLSFRVREGAPNTGIVLEAGPLPHTTGGPRREGTVTVVAGDPARLPAHPPGRPSREVQLAVLQHELGHALGFRGHSPRFAVDVMNGICGFSPGISPEEACFMTLLYRFPPGTPEAILLDATRG